MRVLFSFVGGDGHFEPLVPIARAVRAAGHALTFTAKPAMVPVVRAAGFRCTATGEDVGSDMVARRPLRPFSIRREERAIREGFAGPLTRNRAAGVRARSRSWRPDVIVCDEVDFGAMLAAEALGLKYATVCVLAAGSFPRRELLAGPLNRLRAELSLPSDPELRMLRRYLVLAPFPPAFRDPAFPLPATAQPIRPTVLDPPKNAAPFPWLARLADPPAVWLTLGTEFNRESGDLFARAVSGVRELPVQVVVTIGRQLDPAELGPQPANVRVERFVPQSLLLPHCRAVVCHGGSGSVIGALAYGVPLVILPMGADQAANAHRCKALGVGLVLDAVRASPARIRAGVSRVLTDPAYRLAAEPLCAEARALPGPAHAVELLERLGS